MQKQALDLLDKFLKDIDDLIGIAPLPIIPKYLVMGSIAGIQDIIHKYLPQEVDNSDQNTNNAN